MVDTNGVNTPMFNHCEMSKYGTDTLANILLYRSIVGALQYVTLTRHDIAYFSIKVVKLCEIPLKLIGVWSYEYLGT